MFGNILKMTINTMDTIIYNDKDRVTNSEFQIYWTRLDRDGNGGQKGK